MATLIVVACGIEATVLAQDPVPAPVLQPTPDAATRPPVNTTPAQPAPPVKLEVAAPATAPGGKEERTAEEPEQGRGGGARRGGGGGNRGGIGSRPGGRSVPSPAYGTPWHGPAWGPPAYLTRPYYFDPFWASGAFGWSPFFYAPWSLMWGTVGYWPGPPTTFMTGAVRLKVKPREAQVLVDGYNAGVVNDFDGVFQSLRLAPGGHRIEVRMDGFETLTFDVHVQPDRTLTLTQTMTPQP
jgi:hypothetical protein